MAQGGAVWRCALGNHRALQWLGAAAFVLRQRRVHVRMWKCTVQRWRQPRSDVLWRKDNRPFADRRWKSLVCLEIECSPESGAQDSSGVNSQRARSEREPVRPASARGPLGRGPCVSRVRSRRWHWQPLRSQV